MFKGQNTRINKSVLENLLIRINKINDPKILNSYAKLSDLTTYLRSNDFDGLIAQLHKLTEELNLK